MHLKLAVRVLGVRDDGMRRDPQPQRRLLVSAAAAEQAQHVDLARGQGYGVEAGDHAEGVRARTSCARWAAMSRTAAAISWRKNRASFAFHADTRRDELV